ncbi:hypothetical protein NMS_0368 [Nonlabens marinus S1-08]|uniref:DUF3857 domain-containing protein n=1 Tax=Nonlabens marinus S1-08 TaxID=1454201 RepID=W8VW25_9FLAO|nr:hypothetical protein NMS_0368 [Nonlabens marinus S1-08]
MVFGFNTANGQDITFGEVAASDFKPVEEGLASPYSAEVLYRKEEISWLFNIFSVTQYKKIHERVRINKEEGFKYATVSNSLFGSESARHEIIKDLKAATYQLVDGVVITYPIADASQFEIVLEENSRKYSFTMNSVAPGSIVEYMYEIESPFGGRSSIDLQYDIPIKILDVTAQLPAYNTYDILFNPNSSFVPSIGNSRVDPSVLLGNRAVGVATTQVVNIKAHDIPALEEEPLTYNIEQYRARMYFRRTSSRFREQPLQRYDKSWEELFKEVSDEIYTNELKNTDFLRKEIPQSLREITTREEQVNAALAFVRSKVAWSKYDGFYASEQLKEVYESGSGNVGAINLILLAILKELNMEAYPVVSSSKGNPEPLYPSTATFDYLIVAVKYGDSWLLCDASSKLTAAGELPVRAANGKGRLIKPDGLTCWVNLEPDYQSEEITMNNAVINEDLSISSNVRKRYTKLDAYIMRSKIESLDSLDYKEIIDHDTEVGLEEISLENIDELEKPLEISFTFKQKGIEKIGGFYYLNPLLEEKVEENPFKLESRKLPINFKFPYSQKKIVNFIIPNGFEVVALPNSEKLVYESDVASYQYAISQIGNRITVVSDFQMKNSIIEPTFYMQWKQFFTSVIAKKQEKIVLKKI